MTSLYVRREHQKTQIGHKLLAHFENQAADHAWMIIKVLKDADWAQDFYQKHGYQTLNEEMHRLTESWNMTEKAWEKILYKKRRPEKGY